MLDEFVSLEEADKSIKLTQEEEGALVAEAVADWENRSTLYHGRLLQSAENWRHYTMNTVDYGGEETDDAATTGRANIKLASIARATGGVHAQIFTALFPSGDSFFTPVSRSEYSKQFEQTYSQFATENMAKLGNSIGWYCDLINNILDGVSAVWLPYKREERQRAVYVYDEIESPEGFSMEAPEEFKAQMKPKKVWDDVIDFEGTAVVPISLDDWRIDPTARSIEETSFLWRRLVAPAALEDIKTFKNTEDLIPDASDGFSNDYSDYKTKGLGIDNYREANALKNTDQRIRLYEKWGDFKVDKKTYKNHVLVYSNERTFHYFGPNPYDHGQKPFAISQFIPMPNTLLGKTSVTDAVPMAHAIDTMMNQALDTSSNCAQPIYTYNVTNTALFEYMRTEGGVSPGQLIPRQAPDDVQQFQTSLANLGMLNSFISYLSEVLRETTGGVPYATGGPTGSDDRTLGEVEILASGTNTRFQTLVQMYEKEKLMTYMQQSFENYRQFMAADFFTDGMEEAFTPVQMRELYYDFTITGSRTVLDRNRGLQNMNEIMVMAEKLVMAGVATPSKELIEFQTSHMVEEVFKLKNLPVDDFMRVITPEEMMQQEGPQGGLMDALQGIPGAGQQAPPGALGVLG